MGSRDSTTEYPSHRWPGCLLAEPLCVPSSNEGSIVWQPRLVVMPQSWRPLGSRWCALT